VLNGHLKLKQDKVDWGEIKQTNKNCTRATGQTKLKTNKQNCTRATGQTNLKFKCVLYLLFLNMVSLFSFNLLSKFHV